MTTGSNVEFLGDNNPLSDAASTSGAADHSAPTSGPVNEPVAPPLPQSTAATDAAGKRASGAGEPRPSSSGAAKRPSQSGSQQGADQATWGEWLGLDHLPDLGVTHGLHKAMSFAWKPFEVVGHAMPNGLSLFELNAQDQTTKTQAKIIKILNKFDYDKDGVLNLEEVTALVEYMLDTEKRARRMRIGALLIFIFTCLLLGGMFGLTWWIMYYTKDTKVDSSGGNAVMMAKKGGVIQVANTDFQVVNGTWNARPAPGSSAASITAALSAPLRAPAFIGTQQPLSAAMSIDDLMELNYLHFDSPSGGQLALKVNGVARVPAPQSLYGSVIQVLTEGGTVTIDGTLITFQEELEPIFRNAGFLVDTGSAWGTSRRSLLDAGTEVSGRYNRLIDAVEAPLPDNLDYQSKWLISAESKAAAKDATEQLRKLKANGADDHAYASMWADYKTVFRKSYASLDEDYAAFTTWKKAVQQILDTNVEFTDLNYWATLNEFSDIEFNDFEKKILVNPKPDREARLKENPQGARHRRLLAGQQPAPKVNWTALGKVTPVKKQSSCGCCWAFAAVGALESAYLISTGLTTPLSDTEPAAIDLSEQHFTNCVNAGQGAYTSNGCGGGDPFDAISYAFNRNASTEAFYPYTSGATGKTGACDVPLLRTSKPGQVVATSADANYVYPWGDANAIMLQVMEQPIAIYFMVDTTFMNYAGGIYSPTTCTTSTNHIMLLVGYDRTGNEPYWIIKNSWGTRWGEQGYARVKMTFDADGPCGMYAFTAFPPLQFSQYLLNHGKAADSEGASTDSSPAAAPAPSPSPPPPKSPSPPPPAAKPPPPKLIVKKKPPPPASRR